VLYELKYN